LGGVFSLEVEDQGGAAQCVTSISKRRRTGIKIKSNVKAGSLAQNHNQTVTRGLKVKTNVKAGSAMKRANHNQTAARGLRLKTNDRAGGVILDD
jgi:hypothetical protein